MFTASNKMEEDLVTRIFAVKVRHHFKKGSLMVCWISSVLFSVIVEFFYLQFFILFTRKKPWIHFSLCL